MATISPSVGLKEQLRERFVGKTLNEVPTPSVVLDLAKLERNCQRMLEVTQRLGLLWRAHIKSHKVSPFCILPKKWSLMHSQTTELTRLQVGDSLTTPVSLIVSTITEAENIVLLLKEYQSRGRPVNVTSPSPFLLSNHSTLSTTH
jgi:D-serine deaminase-like pyridoxal phosphate-dependent protein